MRGETDCWFISVMLARTIPVRYSSMLSASVAALVSKESLKAATVGDETQDGGPNVLEYSERTLDRTCS